MNLNLWRCLIHKTYIMENLKTVFASVGESLGPALLLLVLRWLTNALSKETKLAVSRHTVDLRLIWGRIARSVEWTPHIIFWWPWLMCVCTRNNLRISLGSISISTLCLHICAENEQGGGWLLWLCSSYWIQRDVESIAKFAANLPSYIFSFDAAGHGFVKGDRISFAKERALLQKMRLIKGDKLTLTYFKMSITHSSLKDHMFVYCVCMVRKRY